jgi:hypothetical protein
MSTQYLEIGGGRIAYELTGPERGALVAGGPEPFPLNLDETSPLRGRKPVIFGRLSSIKRRCSA